MEERVAEKYHLKESNIFKDDPCWIWHGAKGRGYAVVGYEGKTRVTHKLLYEIMHGAVPKGLELDHVCKNSFCVNIRHLEAVTHSENCKRGRHAEVCKARGAAVTHCPQGHSYTGVNLYLKPNGRRECRQCVRDSGARYRERIKKLLNT